MSLKMKELPELERPYEKLELYGEKNLSNAELLAIIIKTGTRKENSVQIAQNILNMNNENIDELNFLRNMTIEELTKIKGIGKVKAIQLKAIGEIATRMNSTVNYKAKKVQRPRDVAEILMDKMRFEKQEILKEILLDSKNNLLKMKDIAIGSGNFAQATLKSVLNEAVKIEAPKIILVHNHPSGDPTPSKKDYEITKKLEDAAKILGIELIDHIIIGNREYTSIKIIENWKTKLGRK